MSLGSSNDVYQNGNDNSWKQIAQQRSYKTSLLQKITQDHP